MRTHQQQALTPAYKDDKACLTVPHRPPHFCFEDGNPKDNDSFSLPKKQAYKQVKTF